MHLAFAPVAEQRKILAKGQPALTPNTITDPQELIARMAAERAEGLALDLEEQDLRVCAVSAPVLERDGSLRAVLTIVAPAERFGLRERKVTTEAVRNAALQLAEYLNGRAISD
jgi:DNA-binding IclR family transcriptional regulator